MEKILKKLTEEQKLVILLVGVKDKPVPSMTHLKFMLFLVLKTIRGDSSANNLLDS